VAAQRRGSLALVVVVCLLLGVAVGGVLLGPELAAEIAHGGGVLSASKRKLQRLRDFALFRSRGDKAVLRGEPPKPHTKKSPTD
jgi:hypothetical protein